MVVRTPAAAAAAAAVQILDGGMGHLLRRMGVSISGAVGSQERFLGVVRRTILLHDNVGILQRLLRARSLFAKAFDPCLCACACQAGGMLWFPLRLV